jgi:hypothetical protein
MVLTSLICIAAASVTLGKVDGPALSISGDSRLTISLQNQSREAFEFAAAKFDRHVRIDLWDEEGEPVPRTGDGRRAIREFESGPGSRGQTAVIAKGKTHRFRTPALATLFEVRPGRYYSQVIYQGFTGQDSVRIETKVFRVSVRE